LVYLTCAWFSS